VAIGPVVPEVRRLVAADVRAHSSPLPFVTSTFHAPPNGVPDVLASPPPASPDDAPFSLPAKKISRGNFTSQ
jgi:hypothetical protein